MKKFISILTVMAVVGSILFYVRNNLSIVTNHPTVTSTKTQSQLVEYKSPYGFSFQYPSEFRLARAYTKFQDSVIYGQDFDSKDSSLLLSRATEQEEETFVVALKKLTEETPFESIEKGSLFTSKNIIRIQLALGQSNFPEFQKRIEEINKKTTLLFTITNLKEVIGGDGTKGYEYDLNDKKTPERKTSLIFPLKKTAQFELSPGEIKTATHLMIEYQVNSSDDVKFAISQIISTLKFE